MIIGVMSDTHGYLTEMRRAATRMMDDFSADVIVHLGDDSTDADELLGFEPEIISVPGVFEERYHNKTIPNRIIRKFEGVPFLLTHTQTRDAHDLPDDIDPTEAAQDGDVKIILYGHTHKPAITKKYDTIYINPGHLKPSDNRGSNMSFAILNVSHSKVRVRIIDLDDGALKEKTFFLQLF